jgi:UDP-N-acetylmuramoylalanine--D-glutamate ligase
MGDHNLSNLCCALSILKMLELDYKKALSYMGELPSLEHRLQNVFERDGIMFVDDSIATVPESVIAAIDTFKDKDVALIIGGYDNGAMDYAKINVHIEKSPQVKVAVCLPDTGVMVNTSKSVQVKNMQEAVEEALKHIDKGVVLLSPAAQSFNMFKNYKERGQIFAAIAKELCK